MQIFKAIILKSSWKRQLVVETGECYLKETDHVDLSQLGLKANIGFANLIQRNRPKLGADQGAES